MTNQLNNLEIETRLNTLIERIANQFSIDNLHKSPARFDLKKLLWFNEQYIKMLALEEFVWRTEQFWTDLKIDITNPAHKLSLILDKNRINQLNQVGLESSVIWNYTFCDISELQSKKSTHKESIQALYDLASIIREPLHWSQLDTLSSSLDTKPETVYQLKLDYWEKVIKDYLIQNELDYGIYLWPLRLALSGKAKSASSFEILALLDKEEVFRRLNFYLKN